MNLRLPVLISVTLTVISAWAFRPILSQTDTLHIATTHVASPAAVTVVVPKSYLQPGDTARYPTVYLLNGYDGDHTSYCKSIPLDSLADSNNVIFVCPDGRDSWYFDSPADPAMQMESYITREVIAAIDKRLRTRADRSNRAIAGLSMGGHGALWIAMRHPDMFASAGSMSGAVDINMPKFHNRWKIKQWLGSYESAPQIW
ncbi:MAG: prolyl oligopeptidase family serine peptidase, partial [Muribaculum sp.]|nr:prolyl oligopeptidase family serine peptidase [Muribaculum sp.]